MSKVPRSAKHSPGAPRLERHKLLTAAFRLKKQRRGARTLDLLGVDLFPRACKLLTPLASALLPVGFRSARRASDTLGAQVEDWSEPLQGATHPVGPEEREPEPACQGCPLGLKGDLPRTGCHTCQCQEGYFHSHHQIHSHFTWDGDKAGGTEWPYSPAHPMLCALALATSSATVTPAAYIIATLVMRLVVKRGVTAPRHPRP